LAPTASLLQGLTVMQQCVYQMKCRNVCEVKKQLVQPGLVWSRTLSILLSTNGESVSLPVFAQRANTSSIFAAGSCKIDNWMKCQPQCQKCEQNVFLCVMLIKQSYRIG